MALFELSRVGSLAAAARETHVGRYLPLYLAGLLAGVGIGVGVAVASAPAGTPHAAALPATSDVAAAAVDTSMPSTLPASSPAWVAPPPEGSVPPFPQFPAAAEAPAAPAAPEAAAPQAAPATAVAPAAAPAPAPAAAPAAAPAPAVAQPAAAPAAPPAKPDFYVPAVSSGPITDLEQRLLSGINTERANAGLAPYTYDAGLSRIARTRVQQMVDQGYFGHVDPFGYSMYVELLAHFGYTSYAWAGENLALNNYAVSESPERAIVSLMKSPTHRANILAGDFSRIGIGELTTADGRHFYAMIFLG